MAKELLLSSGPKGLAESQKCVSNRPLPSVCRAASTVHPDGKMLLLNHDKSQLYFDVRFNVGSKKEKRKKKVAEYRLISFDLLTKIEPYPVLFKGMVYMKYKSGIIIYLISAQTSVVKMCAWTQYKQASYSYSLNYKLESSKMIGK